MNIRSKLKKDIKKVQKIWGLKMVVFETIYGHQLRYMYCWIASKRIERLNIHPYFTPIGTDKKCHDL